jgi:hypothetical protein
VLAVATFAAVRSANQAARTAERSLMEGLRPLIVPSRMGDPPEKVLFADGHWVMSAGGCGVAEATEDAIYLALSLRNVGSGIAVLHGWHFDPQRLLSDVGHADPEQFRRLTRDLYVPPGDLGFWQGALRDPASEEFAGAKQAIQSREPITVEVLYGDHEGGQRMISRFGLMPRDDGQWLAVSSRHWNLDRPEPR